MKKDYLEDLKDELEESPILKDEMYRILHKYADLYDEYMDDGLTPSKVEEKLGSPGFIVGQIVKSKKTNNRIINSNVYFVTLFSLVLFLMLGYFINVWHPTWLVLLLIPASMLLTKK